MQPKISIITVSYNSVTHIEEAIRSVVNQKYENKEYIIIDGNSTDGTLDIIRKYEDSISVIVSERDRGISDAFNKGIRYATGDIVCIVNSDDIMPENALERFAPQYEEGIDVFRGEEIIRDFNTGKQRLMKPTMEYSTFPIGFNVCHMSTYIRRDAFERFGYYDVDFQYSMDRELLFRFNKMGAIEKRLDGVFGIFRLGGVSQSFDKRKTEEATEVIRRYGASKLEICAFVMILKIRWIAKKIIILIRRMRNG